MKSLVFKIREAQMEKTPYMLVIGDREMNDGLVAPRHRSGENLDSMTPEDFVAFVEKESSLYR